MGVCVTIVLIYLVLVGVVCAVRCVVLIEFGLLVDVAGLFGFCFFVVISGAVWLGGLCFGLLFVVFLCAECLLSVLARFLSH